jgi:hypothetical protein
MDTNKHEWEGADLTEANKGNKENEALSKINSCPFVLSHEY